MVNVSLIRELLESAGKIALDHFLCAAPERKQDLTFVTVADLEVQEFLVTALDRHFPEDGLIAEENIVRKFPASGERYWTIDPIDGTAPYVAGFTSWCIGIGLLEAGRPLCGFVYVPTTREFFHVAERGGVFRNGRERALKPCDVLGSDTILLTHSRPHQRLPIDAAYPGKVFVFGSACIHMSLVATGAADAVLIGHDRVWDLAPGLAMLQRNGGTLRYMGGEQVSLEALLSGGAAPWPMLGGRVAILDQMEEFI